MITVALKGGLGNQMFQYAVGKHVALRRCTSLALHLGWFGNERGGETRRSYALGPFGLGVPLDGADIWGSRAEPRTALSRWAGRRDPRVVQQPGQAYFPDALSAPNNSLLVGYWQSERYFAEIGEIIRADFTLASPPPDADTELSKYIREVGAIGVHVRRGDYITSSSARAFHGVPGVRWYETAVDLIAARVGPVELVVFSDDPDWCEAELRLAWPTTYIRHHLTEPHEDLRLLSTCRHHVIANSSFGWWGAWLGQAPGQVVVAPSPWFRHRGADSRDVIPERWVALQWRGLGDAAE